MLNGATLPAGQANTVTAAQLAQLSYQSGSGADTLWVQANDGTVWGAWSTAFTVTGPIDVGPTVTVANKTAPHGGDFPGSSLFSNYSDPFNSPATQYDFWNTGNGGGFFLLNGPGGTVTPLGSGQHNIITAAQLPQFAYQSGSGADTLWVRANDGTVWGNWSSAFTVTAPIDTGPTLFVANQTATHGQSIPANSLALYSDPFNSPGTLFDYWDTGTGGGHFVLNGTALGANQHNIVTAAQLAQLTYQSGSGADQLWIRANDGTVWGQWSNGFTVTAPIDNGPTLSVINLTASAGQSFPGNSLFSSYSDPFNSPATQYDFYDTGAGGGHFVLSGTALGANQDNIITAAQLAQLSYQSGSGADKLWIRANDGTVWGTWSNAFTVTAPIDLGPTLTVGSLTAIPGQSFAAALLFSYSDAFGSATQYDFWDTGSSGGHFALNGNALGANQHNIITAAQLAQTTYVAGSGTDTLWVRANDGIVWGAFSNSFTVTG